MKRWICCIMSVGIVLTFGFVSAQESLEFVDYHLYYNGKILLSSYPFTQFCAGYKINDSIYLPVRALAEAMDFNVYWNADCDGGNHITIANKAGKSDISQIGPLINTEETAISIAKSVIKERFREQAIDRDFTFTAELDEKGEIWSVLGYIEDKYTFGVEYFCQLYKMDGKIITISVR